MSSPLTDYISGHATTVNRPQSGSVLAGSNAPACRGCDGSMSPEHLRGNRGTLVSSPLTDYQIRSIDHGQSTTVWPGSGRFQCPTCRGCDFSMSPEHLRGSEARLCSPPSPTTNQIRSIDHGQSTTDQTSEPKHAVTSSPHRLQVWSRDHGQSTTVWPGSGRFE